MSEMGILQSLFNESALVALETHYGTKTKVSLREPTASDSAIQIMNLPSDTLVIDLDTNFANDRLFSGSRDCCKRADFMLISSKKKCVLFIEMKRNNPSTKKMIINQLRGSFCVYKYCSSVVEEFFEETFLAAYQVRFVAVLHTVMNKRKTVDRPTGERHDRPEKLMTVRHQKCIQFNQIAGLSSS